MPGLLLFLDFEKAFDTLELPFIRKTVDVDSEKCTFCERETEKVVHLFWACPKTQFFWTNFKVWPQSCQVIARETTLEPDTALGQRPDI